MMTGSALAGRAPRRCPSPATAQRLPAGRGWRSVMIILLAVIVLGGLIWLMRRGRGTAGRVEVPPPPPRPPGPPAVVLPIPRERLADGRIVITGLTKEYPAGRVVDSLSFVVEPGRVTGFLGPNGAGKTTT